MRWSIIWIIFRREVRDQLRDRRTLFMILMLPMMLYPMLGFGMPKLLEALEDKPRRVVLVGAEHLPESPPYPPLVNESRDGFHPSLFDSPRDAQRIRVMLEPPDTLWSDVSARRVLLREGQADAVVLVPSDIRRRLGAAGSDSIPIAYYSAGERSQTTFLRVDRLLTRWSKTIGDERLARENKPPDFAEPVKTEAQDVASIEESGAPIWARIFPFLLVMMSLTGAFYPAIDLCAGEKERGTMETLLISPASRSEIVVGKFLTVMLASILTALLNLAGMGFTGLSLAGSMSALGGSAAALALQPPSLGSSVWMILLLVPLAGFFSALCVALSVLARSMKEGQYYITPLYLVAMPLIFITLMPGIELNLFYSLVPITGVALLLRSLMLGEYALATRYFVPVLLPTIAYGALALRWAVDQFNRESVLFREAERFDLRDYLRHLIRDRGPLPTGDAAVFAFSLMLTAAWFVSQVVPTTPFGIVLGQLGYVLLPILGLTFLLTSSPAQTLRLRWPSLRDLALAVALVLALNPLQMELRVLVEALFPISEAVQEALSALMSKFPSLPVALLVLAVVPAICEELAFRGFILSGLESGHRTRSAILISALLFGFLHVLVSLFHQLFNASLMGLVLGLLAVRTRSIVPGIVFHMLNNGLAVVMGFLASDPARLNSLGGLYRDPSQLLYHWHWVAVGGVISVGLLVMLGRQTPPPELSGTREPG